MAMTAPIKMNGVPIGVISVWTSEEAPPPSRKAAVALAEPLTDTLGGEGAGSGYGGARGYGGLGGHSAPPSMRGGTATPTHHGPTFRRGVGPGSKATVDHAPHFTTGDIQSAVARTPGGIDRSQFRAEIAAHPELVAKMARMVKGEVLGNASDRARIVQLETLFNRSQYRGHDLAQGLLSVGEDPRRGYYATATYRNSVTPGEVERFRSNVLAPVMAGSNLSDNGHGPMTGNASGNVAAHQIAQGTPYRDDLRREGGDTYFREGPFTRELPRLSGTPQGVTRLAPADVAAVTISGTPGISPDAKNAPNGNAPAAFIMHHTAGTGSPVNVVADWAAHRPGIGTQYIMDREGIIHDVAKEYGYGGHGHIRDGTGKGAGLSNQNTVGMEVVARDDADVTQAQRESAQRFVRERYPNTPVFGHGEVNPGHREASEGMTIVNAIRRERGQAMVTPPPDRPHPLLGANGGKPPRSPIHGSPL